MYGKPPAMRVVGKAYGYGHKKSPEIKWERWPTAIKKSKEITQMDELSLTHCKYECKYHIVFASKFRRQIIYGPCTRLSMKEYIDPFLEDDDKKCKK